MMHDKFDCICKNPNNSLEDIHFTKQKLQTCIMSDTGGYGLIILDSNTAIACFNINFCPKCGRKLDK